MRDRFDFDCKAQRRRMLRVSRSAPARAVPVRAPQASDTRDTLGSYGKTTQKNSSSTRLLPTGELKLLSFVGK